MGNVIEFRREKSEQEDTLRQAMVKQQHGELHGLIQIEATKNGEEISIMGAFADHMQYGALAIIKTLGILAEKITSSGEVGHSYSESIRTVLPRKSRPLPERFGPTDLAPLEQPKRRSR